VLPEFENMSVPGNLIKISCGSQLEDDCSIYDVIKELSFL